MMLRINRNIVECKSGIEIRSATMKNELIETLWNVNSSGRQNFIDKIKELIETLWNVNGILLSLSSESLS